MSRTTLPVCPKTGSTSPSLTVHLCLHTALLREIGNAPLWYPLSATTSSPPGPSGCTNSTGSAAMIDVFLFFRDRSNRAVSGRGGVSTPDASANRRMKAS